MYSRSRGHSFALLCCTQCLSHPPRVQIGTGILSKILEDGQRDGGGGGVVNLVRLALHPGGAGVAKFLVAEFYLILCMS